MYAHGILKVGGRLTNTDVDQDRQHWIIIPRGVLAYLLVADTHRRCLHGGIQQMLQFLRQRFWLIDAGALVKSYFLEMRYISQASLNCTTPPNGFAPEGTSISGTIIRLYELGLP